MMEQKIDEIVKKWDAAYFAGLNMLPADAMREVAIEVWKQATETERQACADFVFECNERGGYPYAEYLAAMILTREEVAR